MKYLLILALCFSGCSKIEQPVENSKYQLHVFTDKAIVEVRRGIKSDRYGDVSTKNIDVLFLDDLTGLSLRKIKGDSVRATIYVTVDGVAKEINLGIIKDK